MASPLERVLATLPDAKRYGHRYCVKCPVHEGTHKDSLSFCEVEDGKVLLKCFGGCDTAAILRSLGLEWKDLFPEHMGNGHRPNLRRRRDTEAEQAERINLTLAADYIITMMAPQGPEGPPTEAMGRYMGVAEDLWVLFMQDESCEAVQLHWQALHEELTHAAPKLLAAIERR